MADGGRVLSEFSILHSQVGFEALGELLDEFEEVAINIERCNGLSNAGWVTSIKTP